MAHLLHLLAKLSRAATSTWESQGGQDGLSHVLGGLVPVSRIACNHPHLAFVFMWSCFPSGQLQSSLRGASEQQENKREAARLLKVWSGNWHGLPFAIVCQSKPLTGPPRFKGGALNSTAAQICIPMNAWCLGFLVGSSDRLSTSHRGECWYRRKSNGFDYYLAIPQMYGLVATSCSANIIFLISKLIISITYLLRLVGIYLLPDLIWKRYNCMLIRRMIGQFIV